MLGRFLLVALVLGACTQAQTDRELKALTPQSAPPETRRDLLLAPSGDRESDEIGASPDMAPIPQQVSPIFR